MGNINEGVIVVGYNHNIIFCNNAAQILIDKKEDKIIGWKITDVLEDNEKLLEIYYEIIKTKSEIKKLINTNMIINRKKIKEKILINFACINLGVIDVSETIIILFQKK